MKKQIRLAIFSFIGFLSLLFVVPALAATMPGPSMMGFGGPIVSGNVTSVSGNTVVINTFDNISYSIDASSAVIKKGPNNIIQASGIATGDFIVAQGTINGTSVVAKNIIDTNFNHGGPREVSENKIGNPNVNDGKGLKPNVEMMRRGFAGIVGTVVDSSTFTLNSKIIGKANGLATTTLTVVTTSNTKFTKATSTATFADLASGLPVTVVGTFSTTTKTITATNVHIGGKEMLPKGPRATSTPRGDDRGYSSTTLPRGGGFGAAVYNFFRGFAHFFGR